jgi:RNA polymerase sigma-32 factor
VDENTQDIDIQAETLADDDILQSDETTHPLRESTDLTTYDPLRRYLLEISKFHPIDRENEQRLALRYRETGDHEAAYLLVTSNLRLVIKIAMIYHKVYSNLMDLIQEGNLGLIHAVKRFDPYRGTRLPTYAAWWIKAYILKFLLDNTRMVRIGTTNVRRKILMNLSRQKRALEDKGITPTPQLLAKNLGVAEEEIREVEKGMSGGDISLDAPIPGEDENIRFGDTLHQMEQSVDEKIAHGEFREILEQKFKDFSETLSERERIILSQRLIADHPQTLQQIADLYGISREAVRVAEKRLISKLKKYMVESFGDAREIEFNLRRR